MIAELASSLTPRSVPRLGKSSECRHRSIPRRPRPRLRPPQLHPRQTLRLRPVLHPAFICRIMNRQTFIAGCSRTLNLKFLIGLINERFLRRESLTKELNPTILRPILSCIVRNQRSLVGVARSSELLRVEPTIFDHIAHHCDGSTGGELPIGIKTDGPLPGGRRCVPEQSYRTGTPRRASPAHPRSGSPSE